jgi:hypothetical protein
VPRKRKPRKEKIITLFASLLSFVGRSIPGKSRYRTCGIAGVLIERLGDKLTTNLPVMPERINHAPQSPAVFLPYREDL